jgi:hypothetical protein
MDASDAGISSESSSGLSDMTLEYIKAHKRAAVQQAYLNDTLGFGFSAGGLVFPYYGEQQSGCCGFTSIAHTAVW